MTEAELKRTILCGETSRVQFKRKLGESSKLAAELVAFANSKGGTLIFGIEDKTGAISGLRYEEVQHISAELGNIATSAVSPTIYLQTEVVMADDKPVLVVMVEEGANKPYKDIKGNIWVKQGADKRRLMENSEILRLFHGSRTYHPDAEGVSGTKEQDLDFRLFDSFIRSVYNKEPEDFNLSRTQLLRALQLTDECGRLTLAGLLYFGKQPQRHCPAFCIKAVAFYGTDIGDTRYRDSRDLEGTIPELFTQGMSFLRANLHHVQDGQGFNSIGKLEIPEIALEEMLQNALVHREYIKMAPIRLLIFADRVEIVSPGSLPDGLTVEDIMLGNSFQRNPLMASLCAKTMSYRGLGSGIIRSQREGADIELINQENGNQFTVVIKRPEQAEATPVPHIALPSSIREKDREAALTVLRLCKEPRSSRELREAVGMSNINRFHLNILIPLREAGLLDYSIKDHPTSSRQKYILSALNDSNIEEDELP